MAKSPTPPQGRNLVVCCDGTNNEIGVLLSNVLKLYRIADKNAEQITYYSPGIGTIAMPDAWGRWRQLARSFFEMGTGAGLDRDVLAAYCFLCRHYRDGDKIFLFGFSRGAYTVRVVAGFIYLIGLLREHQMNFAGYALKAYKAASETDNYRVAQDFQRVVTPQCVPIHFMGVWDTVSSVIVPGRAPFSKLRLEELPYTSNNPAVETFRHAIAIDEFRRMFRVKRWDEPQDFKFNPHSVIKSPLKQDIRQVWFAGCHSDVGGGFIEKQSALSKFPLLWMLEQAKDHGLHIRTAMVNHIVKGHPRVNARTYEKPDAAGPLHISMKWYWRVLEIFPKSVRYLDWRPRRRLLGKYIPCCEPRTIPVDSWVHRSVVDRKARVKGYKPVNLPPRFEIESMTGPLTPPAKRRK
ncbi:DUF2235 domain-containing protein [Altererythrobacter sp. Root672]|uniref:DUF2235 domain-containing protein n=1 Tax=Altererythrobacter sp. Root672 TaxID=1736584 RepID=UPI0006F98ECE|nr:DUF2235 domain-containing protein [Altererythrobacter sp. Root672]KRA84046.1 hypothetical protein ASD76_08600 [Altererythrobacter sp. Root672]